MSDLTPFTDGFRAPIRTDPRATAYFGIALVATVAVAALFEAVQGRRRCLGGVLRLGGGG